MGWRGRGSEAPGPEDPDPRGRDGLQFEGAPAGRGGAFRLVLLRADAIDWWMLHRASWKRFCPAQEGAGICGVQRWGMLPLSAPASGGASIVVGPNPCGRVSVQGGENNVDENEVVPIAESGAPTTCGVPLAESGEPSMGGNSPGTALAPAEGGAL